MKRTSMIYSIALIVLAISFTNIFAQDNGEKRPPREKFEHAIIQGTVEAIDVKTREIVLRGSQGNLVTITADESVERFDEIEKNDVIEVDYFTYMLAEFREPTPEELAEPLVILANAEKAPKEMDPAAGVGTLVKAVVTIEIINRPFMFVTIKGPAGNYHSIDVQDVSLLDELNVGEVVILTYLEATVLSLNKVSKSE